MRRRAWCVSLLVLAFSMPSCVVSGWRPQWADARPGAAPGWRHALRARSRARMRDSLSGIMHIVGDVRASKVMRAAEDWYGRGRQRAGVDGQLFQASSSPPPSPQTVATVGPGAHDSSHGRHIAKYLALAAEARAPVAGAVTYNWANERTRLAGAEDGAPSPPLYIAQYSHVYGPAAVWSGNFTGCDRPCQAVGTYGDVAAAATADVVVINLMSPRTQWARPPGQVWVGTYFESPDHYPSLRNAATLAAFNYTTGYRPDADFPVFNMVLDTASHLNKTLAWSLPAYSLKQGRPMLATWISNCHIDAIGRLPLLADLDRHNVTIASYGKCGPGRTAAKVGPDLDPVWREWAASGGSGAEKAAVSAQHLFMYAAENSGCAYYTTEKVFHALVGGTVPVYVGDAASLKRLAPPGSVIYAADFESTAALAAHLKRLARDRDAYEGYLAWRTKPASLDALHRVMALPAWEVAQGGSRACALCEFLWAAPRRVQPKAATDLCQPLPGQGARFRLRL